MARKIMIDTEGMYKDAPLWQELKPKGMLFYIRLISIAEHFGGFEANAGTLKNEMSGLKVSVNEIERFLTGLEGLGKIEFYQSDKKRYGWITKYLNHQKFTHPAKPSIPLPSWIEYDVKGRKYVLHNRDKGNGK